MLKTRKQKGFTLIELLVVITIIGILASISLVSVNVARQRARDVKRIADVSQVQLAMYLYFDDNTHFPIASDPNTAVANWINLLTPALNGTQPPGSTVYMGRVPLDPVNSGSYVYSYYSDPDGMNFTLSYYLEAGGQKILQGQ